MLTKAAEDEGRRLQRYALALPARVDVKIDNKISWHEITRLEDISSFGAGFKLKRPVKRGRLLVISAPMPRQLRCFDFLEPQYRVWGLIRHCIPIETNGKIEAYSVGIAFVGKNPPQSYLEDPAKLYDLADREDAGLWQIRDADPMPDESRLAPENRRHSRFSIPETLTLEMLDEKGDVVASETTVTENLSLGGAAVFTSFNLGLGSFLRVRSDRHDLSIISIVRGKRTGADGMARIHIEFIDHLFPLEGIG